VHQVHVITGTIQRVFREIGVPVLTKTPKRRPRQMMLFEKEEPGDSVQVDVKVVKLAREKVFQYTAIVLLC
jgi:ribosomal protein L19